MHAAIVKEWGSAPVFTTIPDLSAPKEDEIRLRVVATGAHRVVRSRASGRHYTSAPLPHLPGVDGVAQDPATGQLYYFSAFGEGSFAEYINVEKRAIRPLPEGADPVAVAALMNPAMSSWMALASRTIGLEKGFTCVIMGVTTASGRIAVEVARGRGAGKIIGVARNPATLAQIPGLDETIVLKENPRETEWAKLGKVDVILDFVYGTPALAMLEALEPTGKEIQYVHLGSVSGELDMAVPGGILRGKSLTIRGSGKGSWSMREVAREASDLLKLVVTLKADNIEAVPLRDVEKAWNDPALEGKRVVFVRSTRD